MERDTKNTSKPLEELFNSFRNGIFAAKSEKPRQFLDEIGLNHQYLEVGFNSGQFHHRKSDEFKAPFIELGMLIPSDAPVREPNMKGYSSFGDYGLIFPLKDKDGNIVNFYAHRIKLNPPRGEYLNDNGVYPSYPSSRTKRLFVTENVVDGATLMQSGAMENRDGVLALFDGKFSDEVVEAITEIEELEQIIFISSQPQKDLIEKLKQTTSVEIKELQLPDGDSLNEIWQKYDTDTIIKLIDEVESTQGDETKFNKLSDREFFFEGAEVTYHMYGVIPQNPTYLEMDFVIESYWDTYKGRLDLYNEKETNAKLYNWTDDKDLNCPQMILELEQIKKELEKVRRKQNKEKAPRDFSTKQNTKAKQILFSKDLFEELDKLIGEAGIIGQEKSRVLLFLIASSYKFKYNLHAVVHAGDKMAASDYILKIAELIPEQEQYLIDLTASRTFRYYGNSTIDNKLMVIPDYSGITKSKAIGDLKRLQAKGSIINDAPIKGPDGFLYTVRQRVNGHCSSIGACGTTKKHFQDEPRTVLVQLDESEKQMEKLMEYDTMLMTGEVNDKKMEHTKELLQYIIKNIHPLEVINPFAKALMLPVGVRNARMLTQQLQQFTAIVTLFNQH